MLHESENSDAGLRIIDEEKINQILSSSDDSPGRVREILAKARELHGLELEDIPPLARTQNPELLEEIFAAARFAKETIYGKRLVLFAPLYISNLCQNECSYCAFRARNTSIKRRALSQEEIALEVRHLIDQGHKRVLLVAGESYPREGFRYVLDSVATIYRTTHGPGEIRRVNVNVAPLTLQEFRDLKAAQIGTYQLFQETYHRQTYDAVHLAGKKRDYNWRVTAVDRAMEAGIDDCGVGILFGLADWRFDLLALMQHIRHLETKFGVGPHTISVPRIEPAEGSPVSEHPLSPVSDLDFKRIVAILRLAVPYTGIIMSTRESSEMRRQTFGLGVSQISAGSRTNPGGYSAGQASSEQFSLGDHRTLDEVVRDVAQLGYIPSFCTGCYRLGRTGADFMDLAKPGEIKKHCDPNAVSTFQEYLLDYATPETRAIGEKLIAELVPKMDVVPRERAEDCLYQVRQGKRDVYV